MSHAKNKLRWCLNKADKEVSEGKKHRGLIKIKPNLEEAKEHLKKAEHYVESSIYLKEGGFSDISASTIFYSIYHCFLAIALKFGYESRNQECTVALIKTLIEEKQISMKKEIVEKFAQFNINPEEDTALEIREKYQYGTKLSLKEDIYEELLNLSKDTVSETKIILLEK